MISPNLRAVMAFSRRVLAVMVKSCATQDGRGAVKLHNIPLPMPGLMTVGVLLGRILMDEQSIEPPLGYRDRS